MGKFDKYLVNPQNNFSLSDHNPSDRSERSEKKKDDVKELAKLSEQINSLQDMLYAQKKYKILLVLQGMDASGKDGTVKHIFSECDPLGIRLASFKKPTEEELARDYLWRVHQKVPRKGEITVFNRSHYEDVLIVRVNDWITETECQQRYQHIKNFEQLLTDTGTVIIKCFLNISKDEQKQRMYDRLNEPHKHWKFSEGDLVERAKWPAYMQAYENALRATSTPNAPWYVIPADSKTNRNLLISRILLDTLENMDLEFPAKPEEWQGIVVED